MIRNVSIEERILDKKNCVNSEAILLWHNFPYGQEISRAQIWQYFLSSMVFKSIQECVNFHMRQFPEIFMA